MSKTKRPTIRLPRDHANYRHAFRNFPAIAQGHTQARALRTYLIRTALYVPFTTPSGVPYGYVESDPRKLPGQFMTWQQCADKGYI
jgi:hypothetical protein